jgi:hypothetical protein
LGITNGEAGGIKAREEELTVRLQRQTALKTRETRPTEPVRRDWGTVQKMTKFRAADLTNSHPGKTASTRKAREMDLVIGYSRERNIWTGRNTPRVFSGCTATVGVESPRV